MPSSSKPIRLPLANSFGVDWDSQGDKGQQRDEHREQRASALVSESGSQASSEICRMSERVAQPANTKGRCLVPTRVTFEASGGGAWACGLGAAGGLDRHLLGQGLAVLGAVLDGRAVTGRRAEAAGVGEVALLLP